MFGEFIFPLFCTAEISTTTLNTVLSRAYANNEDTQPSILLVTSQNTIPSAGRDPDPTLGALTADQLPDNHFHSQTPQQIATYLSENASPAVSKHFFLIADERTEKDGGETVLLVKNGSGEVQECRVESAQANLDVVSLGVGTRGWGEVLSARGEDGVRRADQRTAPRGQPAPRKQLRSGGPVGD